MDLQSSRKGDSAVQDQHHFSCYDGLRIRKTETFKFVLLSTDHVALTTSVYSCVSCLAGFVLCASYQSNGRPELVTFLPAQNGEVFYRY